MGEDRFYIDCEFDGHGGPLLSFGIESEKGRGLHYRVSDAPPVQDPWVAKNIIPIMGQHCATLNYRGPLNALGSVLRKFIEPCQQPIIIADSPVDIGRFCAAISTNADGKWASAEYPLMRFEVHNVDCWPNDLSGGVQHNAWWDAKALHYALAKAIEARRAETLGSVHESAGRKALPNV